MNKKRPGFDHFVIVIPATQCLIFSNVRNYFRLKIMIKSKVKWGGIHIVVQWIWEEI